MIHVTCSYYSELEAVNNGDVLIFLSLDYAYVLSTNVYEILWIPFPTAPFPYLYYIEREITKSF